MSIRLPRLPGNNPIVDADGIPTIPFSTDWQNLVTQLEKTLNAILAIPAIQAALSDLDSTVATAQAAADAATTAAAAANTAASAATSQTSLQGSYPVPANILTASDVGTSATIFIAAHTRMYSDGSSVSVNSGTVVGLAYSTLYYVYYDDPTFSGGAVHYFETTLAATAAQTGARHTVGSVTTPAASGVPSDGDAVQPPGVGTIVRKTLD